MSTKSRFQLPTINKFSSDFHSKFRGVLLHILVHIKMLILILGEFQKPTTLKREVVNTIGCDDYESRHAVSPLMDKVYHEDIASQPELINKADFPHFVKVNIWNHLEPPKK